MNARKTFASALLAMITTLSIAFAADEDTHRPHGSATERKIRSGESRTSKSMTIFGIEAGINYSMFSQTMNRTPGSAFNTRDFSDSPENVLESGTGISPYFGIMADFPVAGSVGIQLRALYDPKKVSREFTGAIDATTFGFPPQVFNMETVSKYTLTMTNLTMALAVRVDLTSSVFVTAGPLMQLTMGDISRADEWRVAHPDSLQFITVNYQGQRDTFKIISRDSTRPNNFLPKFIPTTPATLDYQKTRFGLEIGLGGKFDIGQNLWLSPHVRYQYMFTPLHDNFTTVDLSRLESLQTSTIEFSNPKLHSLQLGLALWFGI